MIVVSIGEQMAYEGEPARAAKIAWELKKIFDRYDLKLPISVSEKKPPVKVEEVPVEISEADDGA